MAKIPSFDGRRIIVGITGGIACYKIAEVVSKLVQNGAAVNVLMTDSAARFIAPLTFASLTGNAVFDSQWSFVEGHDPQHIRLAKNADAMLIAPCTMNMLAKLTHGLTDDPVSLVASAIDPATVPIILAPSMNSTMLGQASTQRNLQSLSNDGFTVLETQNGWQACKTVGQGRMEDPLSLIEALGEALVNKP